MLSQRLNTPLSPRPTGASCSDRARCRHPWSLHPEANRRLLLGQRGRVVACACAAETHQARADLAQHAHQLPRPASPTHARTHARTHAHTHTHVTFHRPLHPHAGPKISCPVPASCPLSQPAILFSKVNYFSLLIAVIRLSSPGSAGPTCDRLPACTRGSLGDVTCAQAIAGREPSIIRWYSLFIAGKCRPAQAIAGREPGRL